MDEKAYSRVNYVKIWLSIYDFLSSTIITGSQFLVISLPQTWRWWRHGFSGSRQFVSKSLQQTSGFLASLPLLLLSLLVPSNFRRVTRARRQLTNVNTRREHHRLLCTYVRLYRRWRHVVVFFYFSQKCVFFVFDCTCSWYFWTVSTIYFVLGFSVTFWVLFCDVILPCATDSFVWWRCVGLSSFQDCF